MDKLVGDRAAHSVCCGGQQPPGPHPSTITTKALLDTRFFLAQLRHSLDNDLNVPRASGIGSVLA